jgi:mannose-6-phosphate isomerase-like protein (cupin superfamily)
VLSTKLKSTFKQVDESTKVWEYQSDSDDYSVATSLVNGRHPMKGYCCNTINEQAYFVISGKGKVELDNGQINEIKSGDYFHFNKNQYYSVYGENLEVVIFNTPPWEANQMEFKD